MKNVITIRPGLAAEQTVQAAAALGLDVSSFPLWEVQPREWQAPPHDEVDALLIGSGNALLHAGEQVQAFKDKPVHAVGPRTAQVARDHGFTVGSMGTGGLQRVLDALPKQEVRLLRLAGADHMALDYPPHVSVIFRVVYEMVALGASPGLEEALREGAMVLLHSGVAARYFSAECDRLGMDRSRIEIAALAPRIAEAAGGGWAAVSSAPQPSDAALLALLREMRY